MSRGALKIVVFIGLFLCGSLSVSHAEEAELSRRDKFLVQELSILGQGIEPIQRANPVMRATDWKDTLRGWKNFLLEPEDTPEKERRRHLESLERLRALNDRRSFNALYHISYPEAYRYHPRTTVRAKEILFELIYLWNLDQFNTIEQAIEKRIEELKNSSHYVMLNGRHDPGSVRLIEKEEKYSELLLRARESYDPTIQDGGDETFYNYKAALEGAANVPRGIIGFFLFDTLLSNHPKNLIALPTRFVSGLIQAVYHGIKDIPDEISGLFTAGHYGSAGYELGQKTANTVIVLVPTVKLAKRLAHYQLRLPEQYFGDPGNAQRPSPNGINPYVPDLSPKPEWGNPHLFDNTYRPQLPTQTPQGFVATLVNPFTEVLPRRPIVVPDVLPQELWLDTPPVQDGITFVIPPGDYFPERKGKIKVIIIRKDNDGNILGYEETEIDEDTVLQDLKIYANDEVLGFNIPHNKPSDISHPQASNSSATVFVDLAGYTELSTKLQADELLYLLEYRYYPLVKETAKFFGGDIKAYEADGILIHFANNGKDPVQRALEFFYTTRHKLKNLQNLEIKAGLSLGETYNPQDAKKMERAAKAPGDIYTPIPDLNVSKFNDPQFLPHILETAHLRMAPRLLERRTLSILFFMWEGPHWETLKNQARSIIASHQGTIVKELPDVKPGFLIEVGAPSTENNPIHMMRIALELKKLAMENGSTAYLGGAHGDVLYGEIGGEIDVIGRNVNLASRLASSPNEILVNETAYLLTQERISFGPKSMKRLKGLGEVPSFEVQELKHDPQKWKARAFTIGRQAELHNLKEKLEKLRSAQKGDLILYEGEAGVGKSHLLSVLREYVVQDGFFTLEARVDESGRSPFKDFLSKLDVPHNLKESVQYEALLWYQGKEARSLQGFEPEQKRQILKSALIQLLSYHVQRKNTVMFVEDLHLLPAEERDFLFEVCEEVSRKGALIYFSTRPPTTFENKRKLENLNRSEVHEMIEEISSETLPMDQKLFDFIYERSKGNPLFVTALVDYLKSHGFNEQSLQGVPLQIEGLLQSRIDALTPQAKALFQVASAVSFGEAIDISFLQKVIEAQPKTMDDIHVELNLEALQEIKEKGLLSHILYKDVARSNMPRKLRIEVHSLAALLLMKLYPESRIREAMIYHAREAEQKGLLGRWLIKGVDEAFERSEMERVVRYAEEALHLSHLSHEKRADLALKLGLAKVHLGEKEEALRILEGGLKTASSEQSVRLLVHISEIYLEQGKIQAAKEKADKALEIAQKLHTPEALLVAVKIRGGLFSVARKNKEALECYTFALGQAERLKDITHQAKLHYSLGISYNRLGNSERAVFHFQKSIDFYKDKGSKIGAAYTLSVLAMVYKDMGQKEKCVQLLEESLEVFRETGYLEGEGEIHRKLGDIYLHEKHWNQAEDRLREAQEIFRKVKSIKNEIYVYEDLGLLELMRHSGQETGRAQEYFHKAYELAKDYPNLEVRAGVLTLLGLEKQKKGEHQAALTFFQKAYHDVSETDAVTTKSACLVNMAEAYCDTGNMDEALLWAIEAQKFLKQHPNAEHEAELQREVLDKIPQ